MKKKDVKVHESGFTVKATDEYIKKQEREKRMQDRKSNKNKKPTVKDLYELMLDIAERQSEIYDLLKNK